MNQSDVPLPPCCPNCGRSENYKWVEKVDENMIAAYQCGDCKVIYIYVDKKILKDWRNPRTADEEIDDKIMPLQQEKTTPEANIFHRRVQECVRVAVDAGRTVSHVDISTDLFEAFRPLLQGIIKVDNSLPPDTVTCRYVVKQVKPDPRAAHTTDDREATPL